MDRRVLNPGIVARAKVDEEHLDTGQEDLEEELSKLFRGL
jgi:hypothetical protein